MNRMKETEIEGQKVYHRVKKSRQATRVRIKYRQGLFTLVVPENIDINSEEVLKQNSDWILRKIEDFREIEEEIPFRNYQAGEVYSVLGEEKVVKVETSRSNSVNEDIVLASHLVDRTGIKDQLEKALRNFVRSAIEEKVDSFSDRISGEHNRVYIRDQKTRWGSCSGQDNLNFNWRLVFGPEKVLEYVVVHEMVHLEHRDHSEKFWRRVEEILPNYSESREWLNENSHKLVFENNPVIERKINEE